MSAINTQCPPESMLSDFGLGKLDATQAETVGQHLETCADCRQRVASLSGDSFVNRLRGVSDGAAAPDRIEHTFVGGDSASNAAHSSETPWGKRPESRPAEIPRPSRPSPTVDDKSKRDGPVPARRDSAPPELANHPDYELIKELGQGGMGVVYLAKNRMMDRLEVLKVVSKALLDKPGALERFQQEIRSAAKLLHPNIVAAHSVLRPGDLLVFAMEYVPGQDLMQVVKKRGHLPIANAAFYAHQVAQGLQHAHEAGMVHRDIKPNNLMLAIVGKKHIVKILDFGLAKATSEKAAETALTKSGQMLGTPDYVAPEQTLDAHKADIRADIYSLGCTLYYFLAARPPFQEASLYALLESHQKRDAQPLNLVRPDVPVELAAVVAKMLAKDPAKRYQTPIEVARALTPFFKPGQAPAAATLPPAVDVSQQPASETIHAAASATEESIAVQPVPVMPVPIAAGGIPASLAPIPLTAAPHEAGISIDLHRDSGRRRRGWWRSRPPWQQYAMTGGAAALLLWGIVLLVQTPRGAVEIELSDPNANVAVSVDGNHIDIAGLDAPLSLDVGEHDIKVAGKGYETFTKKFAITKGKNAPLTVTLILRETARSEVVDGAVPSPAGNGRVWHVKAGASGGDGRAWNTALGDLQHAIAQVADVDDVGKQIWVAAGRYTPAAGTDRKATFRLPKGVAILGGFVGSEKSANERDPANNRTILSGDLLGDDAPDGRNRGDNCFHVVSAVGADTSSILDGFVVTGGHADRPDEDRINDGVGGGILLAEGAATIRRCEFVDNFAARDGGAAYSYLCQADFARCRFERNHCGGGGGGVYLVSVPELRRGELTTMRDCVFAGNSAPRGGAMATFWADPAHLVGCEFRANAASAAGGGLYNDATHLRLTSCLFHGNRSAEFGGAINAKFTSSQRSLELTNCTLSGNKCADGKGESIRAWNGAQVTLNNCVVSRAESDPFFIDEAQITARHSCIAGGWAGEGNIDADPQFVDPSGDYHLRPNSSCIDAGDDRVLRELSTGPATNTDLARRIAEDFVGRARLDGPIDIGAFESPRPVGGAAGAAPVISADNPVGFEPLFNGKNLSGWQAVGNQGWSVRDGTLVAQGSADPGWLMSDRNYTNFELELEYSLSRGAQTGVFLHASPDGDVTGKDIHEVQIIDDEVPDFAQLAPDKKNGALWSRITPKAHASAPAGVWNRLGVTVRDDRVKVRMNGIEVVDGQLPIAKANTGRIGLQFSEKGVEFRNIEVRDLDATAAATANGAATSASSKSLPTNADTSVNPTAPAGPSQQRLQGAPTATRPKLLFEIKPDFVLGAALSPDGTMLLAGDNGGTHLYEAHTGQRLQEFAHGKAPRSLAFLPDGRSVVTGDWEGKIGLWDVETRNRVGGFDGNSEGVYCIAISDDGSLVLTCAAGKSVPPSGYNFRGIKPTVRLWDVQTRQELRQMSQENGRVGYAAFLPRSHRVVWGAEQGTLGIWDADTGNQVDVIERDLPAFRHLAVSVDGRYVVGTMGNNRVFVWDVAEEKRVQRFDGDPKYSRGAIFSPDGSRVLSIGEEDARLWDISSGNEIARTEKFQGGFGYGAFYPDGSEALLTSYSAGKGYKWLLPGQGGAGRSADDHDREVAEWVLSKGGKITVEGVNGEIVDAAKLKSVQGAPGSLKLTKIYLGHWPWDAQPWPTAPNDADLARIQNLPNLTDLFLHATSVGDRGLAQINTLPRLSTLNIGRTKVTDAGMQYLKQFKDLTDVQLQGTAVGDEGLEQIVKGLPKLRTLNLEDTSVTSAGMQKLSESPRLEYLVLNAPADDAVLGELAKLPMLNRLEISGDRITNGG